VGSLSGSDWGPLPTVDETVLCDGAGDDLYLQTLAALLKRMPRPALAFVLAGGDVLRGDRFGRLGLTLAGARRRDHQVARALQGVPSVWLPAGGYHHDAWRVLAGTAMVLMVRWDAPNPERYDPLVKRFAGISAELLAAISARRSSTPRIWRRRSASVGNAAGRGCLLGYYTATGLEHGLYRYGVMDQLRRIGYGGFHITFDRTGLGERLRLNGRIVPPRASPRTRRTIC